MQAPVLSILLKKQRLTYHREDPLAHIGPTPNQAHRPGLHCERNQKMLETEQDEKAQQKTRVRLFQGTQEVDNEQTLAALTRQDVELEALVQNGLACDCHEEDNVVECSWCGFATCDYCGTMKGERLCSHCEPGDMVYECFRCIATTGKYWHYCLRCNDYLCGWCKDNNIKCPNYTHYPWRRFD